jgi:hypothetical protein
MTDYNEPTPIYDSVDKPDLILGQSGDIPTIKPSAKPQPKVVAATIGAGVGYAVGEVLTYVIETAAAIDIPTNVEQAIGLILTAGLSFVAGYVKKN